VRCKIRRVGVALPHSTANCKYSTGGVSHDVLSGGVCHVGHRTHCLMRVEAHDDQVYSVGGGELQNPFRRESKLDEVVRMRQ